MPSPKISFEFFPPQSLEASFRLWETVLALAPFDPGFVSVTYGAGGTTRKLTHEAVATIGKNYGLNVAAHLTCVEATKEETMEIAESYAAAGVKEIVALRGDAPKGADRFTPHPEGFANAVELIEALAETGKFKLHVGAYPEPHPEAKDTMDDVRWLKQKIDAGATSAITQFFFDADTFFRFRDACEKQGIDAPIIPGILPIQSWSGTKRFAQRCGAHVPSHLDDAFERAEQEGRAEDLAISIATDLCTKLLDGGVEHLHFYTLNRPHLTQNICHSLDIAPKKPNEKVA